MKTASVQQLPQQWPEILRWVAGGEEVQVTEQDKVVARIVPAMPAPQPDFLARAEAVWGEQPQGKPLSEVVVETRLESMNTPKLSKSGVPAIPMNEPMSWEDWLAGRRARRETGNRVAPEIIRRPSSSSDRRLRKLFNGERGLPFKKTEEL